MPSTGASHHHDHSHAHDHGHDHAAHAHGHVHAPASFGRAFAVGITLNVAYVVGEVVYGLVAHSLALLADAGHNAGDVLGLGAAWLAASLGQRRPTARFTYGLRASSILAALLNAVILLVVTGGSETASPSPSTPSRPASTTRKSSASCSPSQASPRSTTCISGA